MLMINAGDALPDAPGTRFGGLPLAPAGFAWPTCSSCENPMQFVAQVELSQAENDARLLSIFMCSHDSDDCDTGSHDSGANRAFVFTGPLHPVAEPEDADPDDDVVMDASAAELVEVDVSAEQPEFEFDVEYDLARRLWWKQHPNRDIFGQLGGEPSWFQADNVPDCPSCGRAMPLAAQLGEHGANYGTGEAYAFHCPTCDTAAFMWQC
jgi:hypothetical protein